MQCFIKKGLINHTRHSSVRDDIALMIRGAFGSPFRAPSRLRGRAVRLGSRVHVARANVRLFSALAKTLPEGHSLSEDGFAFRSRFVTPQRRSDFASGSLAPSLWVDFETERMLYTLLKQMQRSTHDFGVY